MFANSVAKRSRFRGGIPLNTPPLPRSCKTLTITWVISRNSARGCATRSNRRRGCWTLAGRGGVAPVIQHRNSSPTSFLLYINPPRLPYAISGVGVRGDEA